MSTDAFLAMFGARDAHEPRDPMKAAQSSMRGPLPKRFFQNAQAFAADGVFALRLDGRTALTPKKRPLKAPSPEVAQALADEWNAQTDILDPARMPLTRLLNSALDGVADALADVRSETARYAASDLICYRADAPETLVARQSEAWDPLVRWVAGRFQARLALTAGVMHVQQEPEAVLALGRAVTEVPGPFALAALSTLTSLTGSVVIALALRHDILPPDQAWAAAHVDETFQAEVWGQDEEAQARLVARRRDFDAAMLLLRTQV
jgi:chaperone required for assembly of F1-ATPase